MIKLDGLKKTLGNLHITDINVQIAKNEYFVILGPTATGKTVLLELIAGLQHPDQGEIYFAGNRVTVVPPELRKVGMVYQDYCLFPHLNVKENICFGLKAQREKRVKIEEAFAQIVQLFEIEHLQKRRVLTLSGGEQQRVAIARALITAPDILLLDEPLSALDPETKVEFQARMKQIHVAAQTTTIHVTHDFNEAIALADRIAIVHDGKIVQVGTPDEIFKHPASAFVAKFVGARNIFHGIAGYAEQTSTVRINEKVSITAFHDHTANRNVNITIRPEDVFLAKVPRQETNCFRGKITGIFDRFSLTEVTVEIGVPITAYLTRQYLDELAIGLGDSVYVGFKPSAVHIFQN